MRDTFSEFQPRRGVWEREILRVGAVLRTTEEPEVEEARRVVLKWAEKRVGSSLPRQAWNFDAFECPVAGRECAAVRIKSDSEDVWAIRANDPDKTIPQRTWTTEVVVGRYNRTYLSLRLLMSSSEREEPHIEPAVPALVRQIHDQVGLVSGTKLINHEPWIVESDGAAESLISRLVDPKRKMPQVVLTVPNDSTGASAPLLDPYDLARMTIGIAEIVVVPARFTWILTRFLSKRLSVFGGAVRVYLQGFSEDSNPYDHELFFIRPTLPDDSANANGSEQDRVRGELQRMIARSSVRQFRLGYEVLPYRTVRDRYHKLNREKLGDVATVQDRLDAAYRQIESLKDNLESVEQENDWYATQYDLAESRAREAEDARRTANHRIQGLEERLRSRGEDPNAGIDLPDDWRSFSEWCYENLRGRIVLLSSAKVEIKKAKFEDVSLAARCVLWLASYYRDKRLHGHGSDLRMSVEDGVHNDRCGGDGFPVEWNGNNVDVDWHIKSGGNTREPRRCLRIYYFWDDASQQVVIASMPAHVHNNLT